LGRNLKLSMAEVFSYFEKEGIQIKNYVLRKNALLLETNQELGNIIEHFGGVISIGEIIAFGNTNEIIKQLEKISIYDKKENKFNYILWDFSDESKKSIILTYLKNRFRTEKLKATEKHLGEIMDLQNRESVRVVSSGKLIDEQYFIFEDDKTKNCFFGKIIQKCDYKKIEQRDMKKPVRRNELAISPRLAKIMINLSQAKKGDVLLDPFCGIGVILGEALSENRKVIGVDNDKIAIENAKRNLFWFGFKKEDYNLIVGDSRKIKINKANVIVTEPHLGQILKKIVKKEEAEKMANDFERLIISILGNLKNSISGKIVFTSPLIQTNKGRVSCNVENILNNTGLKLCEIKGITFPIPEFRKNQIVGREIFVLKKK